VAAGSPHDLTTGSANDLRFRAAAGLETASLAASVGCLVREPTPGEYVVESEPTPRLVAGVTAWLAEHDQPLDDLRAGRRRLEDVFRILTSDARDDGTTP
jgi:ABC-2 type transport system ATP-binding protein